MSPLPGWQVVPRGWAQHHQPTLNGTRTVTAQISRLAGGPAPYPRPVDWTGRIPLWETPARLQMQQRGGVVDQAEQPQVVREYTLALPLGGPELRVGEGGDVATIEGRDYRLLAEQNSSVHWERLFTVSLNQTQNGV